MPRRKTPRDPEQARKLAIYFRERFLTPEARAVADREWKKFQEAQARAAEAQVVAEQRPFTEMLSPKERDLVPQDAAFSDDEKARAAKVLAAIRQKYGTTVH